MTIAAGQQSDFELPKDTLYLCIYQVCCMRFTIPTRFYYIDGLAQDFRNSIANALELLQSCAKPAISTGHLCFKLNSHNYLIHTSALSH